MLKKPIKIFIIFSITVLVSAILFTALLTFKSIPNYNRVVTSSFVEKDVKIIRNDYAIPNIIGQSNEDTFYALGYVHAQDRLWQMVFSRRMAQGRLSEILGRSALESDILMRTLNIYNLSQKAEKKQSEEMNRLLLAYSNGVNTFINENIREKSENIIAI